VASGGAERRVREALESLAITQTCWALNSRSQIDDLAARSTSSSEASPDAAAAPVIDPTP
jgi:hypothetical protein